jgi:hypothetical protein
VKQKQQQQQADIMVEYRAGHPGHFQDNRYIDSFSGSLVKDLGLVV